MKSNLLIFLLLISFGVGSQTPAESNASKMDLFLQSLAEEANLTLSQTQSLLTTDCPHKDQAVEAAQKAQREFLILNGLVKYGDKSPEGIDQTNQKAKEAALGYGTYVQIAQSLYEVCIKRNLTETP